MDNLYKIKPLAWVEWRNGSWRAYTQLGNYTVNPNRWYYWLYVDLDEGSHNCASIEAGKAAAEAHWRERILPMLEEVK